MRCHGDDLTPISSLTIDEEEAAVLNEKVPVVLYFGNEQQNKLSKRSPCGYQRSKKELKPLLLQWLKNY